MNNGFFSFDFQDYLAIVAIFSGLGQREIKSVQLRDRHQIFNIKKKKKKNKKKKKQKKQRHKDVPSMCNHLLSETLK